MALEDLITAAEAEVTQAKALPDTDSEKALKVARAEAKVAGLKAAQAGGYTKTQAEIDAAVQQRVPDAEGSGRTAERKALAAKLNVSVEDLDAEVERLAGERRSGETQADQERRAKAAAEADAATAKAEAAKYKKTGESAREYLRNQLIRGELERELLKQGVINTEEVSYLEGAYNLTDKSAVNVQIDIKDDGTLEVKGGVTGVKEAVEKTKQQYAAFFGEPAPENPHQTPGGGDSGGGAGGGAGGGGTKSAAQSWAARHRPQQKQGAASG